MLKSSWSLCVVCAGGVPVLSMNRLNQGLPCANLWETQRAAGKKRKDGGKMRWIAMQIQMQMVRLRTQKPQCGWGKIKVESGDESYQHHPVVSAYCAVLRVCATCRPDLLGVFLTDVISTLEAQNATVLWYNL